MAKYILQFVFLGFDGFRFPIAYFPSAGANAPELYINVWNSIMKYPNTDFPYSMYVLMVGVQTGCFK